MPFSPLFDIRKRVKYNAEQIELTPFPSACKQ